MSGVDFSRRHLLIGAAGLSGLSLSACDQLSENKGVKGVLGSAEHLTRASQRLIQGRNALAKEFTLADLSPVFKANGSKTGAGPEYQAHIQSGFANWRLAVDGLVHNPMSLSLAELRRLPSRTQITRHDCVEGWSAIGQWTGVPLGLILKAAGLRPEARFVVFHCADNLDANLDPSGQYYESIELIDAFHPQTILAYGMNGKTLAVEHGAPLRLRVERQLGYKQAKYIMRIEAVDSFARIKMGKGGFWEDRGYEWYAGI